ncbi:MAG: hypothetical protein J0H31_24260, partial [Alphaproteobacteria bacterium]|nr:hypothetical protein [Alphaproteobacteria bacterium]
LDAFRQANIEIPFPQRDVHVKSSAPAGKWPADDDKVEMEFAERELARAKAAELRREKGRRKSRRPDPG